MPLIRQLPPKLINQIAAGEVIERPASVAKELLENSIDAGARRIEVCVERGGAELIRISDDGCGIAADQLPLAVTSHATSKLPDDETLFRVSTLGFRGEALASIGSVAHLTIRSRPAEADAGAELSVRGGVLEGPQPSGCPTGTVIEVRNLFFNTPVRRKFMRTPQTEMGHLVDAFTRVALANPQVHMVLRSGDRELHDLPASERWTERIRTFFGAEIADSLIHVSSDDGQVQIDGYACDPSVSRGNTRMQYLFLNGRPIRDRSLQHALGEAYRGLLMTGRQPVCFLRLAMPAEMVDVNVHPSKLEVRFADGGRIYSHLLRTLRHRFLSTDLTARVGSPPAAEEGAEPPAPLASSSSGSVLGMSVAAEAAQRQGVIDWARGSTSAGDRQGASRTAAEMLAGRVAPFVPFPDAGGSFTRPPSSGGAAEVPPWERNAEEFSAPTRSAAPAEPGAADEGTERPSGQGATSRLDAAHAPAASHLGFQVHNRYLVTEDERGMVVVDQHALHERVLYERIREKVLHGNIETQQLLVPEPVSLTPAEQGAAMEARELLSRVGIEIEPFGGDTLLVRSYPAMLANLPPGEILRQALESLLAAGKDPEVRDLLDHLLHSIACKAAIKAGDRLSGEEITSLLEQRDLYQDTHHCPHGRPTALFFSRDELDRMFGRLGPRRASAAGSGRKPQA